LQIGFFFIAQRIFGRDSPDLERPDVHDVTIPQISMVFFSFFSPCLHDSFHADVGLVNFPFPSIQLKDPAKDFLV